jgi:hypothetical protein
MHLYQIKKLLNSNYQNAEKKWEKSLFYLLNKGLISKIKNSEIDTIEQTIQLLNR